MRSSTGLLNSGRLHIWHHATTSECPAMKEGAGNRGGREKRQARDSRWPSQATATQVRGHAPFQPGADRRPGADPHGYRAGGEKTCSTTGWPALPSRAAHTTRKWAVIAVSPRRPEQSAYGLPDLPALRIRPLFCFLTGSMVTRSDDIEQCSNNFGQCSNNFGRCSKMIEDCSH